MSTIIRDEQISDVAADKVIGPLTNATIPGDNVGSPIDASKISGTLNNADIDYSDLNNVPTEFTPSAHDHNAADITTGINTAFNKDFGSSSQTVCEGNDTRLSDARTPLAHIHDASNITSGIMNTARLGSGTADNTKYLRGDNTWQDTSSLSGAPSSVTAVGSVIFASPKAAGIYNPGSTTAGTNLRYGGASNGGENPPINYPPSTSSVGTGTWRCTGYSIATYPDGGGYVTNLTTWQRIA